MGFEKDIEMKIVRVFENGVEHENKAKHAIYEHSNHKQGSYENIQGSRLHHIARGLRAIQ